MDHLTDMNLPQRPRFRGAIAISALCALLASLGIGMLTDQVVAELAGVNPWLDARAEVLVDPLSTKV